MKLTDEMRKELASALEEHGIRAAMMTSSDVVSFLSGYRMGQRDMRERAAKACDAADERAYPFACAVMIRALPVEDANG